MKLTEQIKDKAGQLLESLGEGWSKLVEKSGNALTRFTRSRESTNGSEVASVQESWGIMAGEIAETPRELIVRLEAPGMEKDDFDIRVDGDLLRIRGEKRFAHEERDANYHLVEAAYGAFERNLALPRKVDAGKVEAKYRRGVLTIRLPKLESEKGRHIPIN